MLPEDVFRSRLEATVASLSYWAPTIKNAARVVMRDEVSSWRMTVEPHLRAACALDLAVHASQTYDVTIAGETFKGLPVGSLDIFLPLAEAVAEGRVVQRRYETPATGALHTIETIVPLQGGREWRAERINEPIARLVSREECLQLDHRFPPYHRI